MVTLQEMPVCNGPADPASVMATSMSAWQEAVIAVAVTV